MMLVKCAPIPCSPADSTISLYAGRLVVALVHGLQDPTIERLHAQEHLVAAGAAHELDEPPAARARQCRIGTSKGTSIFSSIMRVSSSSTPVVLVEVVRREEEQADPCGLGGPQALRSSSRPAGCAPFDWRFDDRTEIAGLGTPSRGIDALHVVRRTGGGRASNRAAEAAGIQRLGPSPVNSVERGQFSGAGVGDDLRPVTQPRPDKSSRHGPEACVVSQVMGCGPPMTACTRFERRTPRDPRRDATDGSGRRRVPPVPARRLGASMPPGRRCRSERTRPRTSL